MKAQIKNEDAQYLKTMIEDLFSVRIAAQTKFTEGDFHTTVEYEGINRVEKFIIQECANLNNDSLPAYKVAETTQTRGEEMLAELEQINEELETKAEKLKVNLAVKKALREVINLTYEASLGMTELRKKINAKIEQV